MEDYSPLSIKKDAKFCTWMLNMSDIVYLRKCLLFSFVWKFFSENDRFFQYRL